MKRSALAKAAVSSLIVGTTLVACTNASVRPSSVAEAGHSVSAAEKALAAGDGARAVLAAQAVVQGAPQDAAARQLLGRAYVASGRFASAETALSDAMTLGNRDARTIISLALVKVALGKSDAARELLVANADVVPAGDYGLAMAMAGDAAEGVRILSEAIHDSSATARTRQNLAYAYALAGRWKDARLLAGLDLEPLVANQRITQWAQTAAPGLATERVAALMGVTIDAADAGQPTALALAPQAAPVAVAQATSSAPQPEPAAEPAPVETAAAAPVEADYAAAVQEAPAPTFSAPVAPVRAASFRPSAAVRAAAAPRRIQASLRIDGRGSSNWVVQLGAYDNAAIAKEKYYAMARRNSAIASLPVLTSQVSVNGATYARLAVSGFNDRAEAVALCRELRARNGQCFVRENAPDATPQRWALAAKPRQFASR
ncbi:MAG TPA: tetratricopeptide repeat protein [Sphingobium sp.]|nr:tetratricopeptide repeat protein [Sphingobium sp.]